MIPSHLPGSTHLRWVKSLPLRIGALTGVYLALVMSAALLTANRLAWLEPYADLRNWCCRIVFLMFTIIPVGIFHRAPWKLFTSGATAWCLFTLSYSVAGIYFDNLHSRLNIGTFQMLSLGVGSYAVIAVAFWVAETCKRAAEHLFSHEPVRDRAVPPRG